MANATFNPAGADRNDFEALFSLGDDLDNLKDEIHTARGAHDTLDDRLDATDGAIAEVNADISTNIKPDISGLKTDVEEIDGALDTLQADVSDAKSDILDISQAQGTLSDSLDDEIDARMKTDVSVAGVVDSGGKNRATVNIGSATLRTSVPVNLPAGKYVIYFGEITSTDTDASVCLLSLLNESSTSVWTGGTTRGEGKTIEITITDAAASLMVYASDNYSHGTGDTVAFSNLMICSKSDWDASQTYVPYCPTMQELYQMILALQAGGAS